VEIDGASNNSVEDVRGLRDAVKLAPNRGKFRIYIIDEVHMLSNAAFNALLKTLEEPPPHVKFIFATTDVQKVLPTILSRCQRFDLRRIPAHEIAAHLTHIAEKEGIQLSATAAGAIARGAEGGLRDAESMLDQLVAFCGESINEADVLQIFGFTGIQTIVDLSGAILRCDSPKALQMIQKEAEAGRDLASLLGDLVMHFRNLLVFLSDPDGMRTEATPELLRALDDHARLVTLAKVLDVIEGLAGAEGRMRWAANKKMHLEVGVIRAIQTLQTASLDDVLEAFTSAREAGTAKVRTIGRANARTAADGEVRAPETVAAPLEKVGEPSTPLEPMEPTPVVQGALPEKSAALRSEPLTPLEAVHVAPTVEASESVAAVPLATYENVRSLWDKFVRECRNGSERWGRFVSMGQMRFDTEHPDTVVLAFAPSQRLAKEALETDAPPVVEAWFTRESGLALRLVCIEDANLVSESTARRDPIEEFKDDPLIRKALEIFRAELELPADPEIIQ
jgi:DNA polymerase-3 subunit gamma/tau